jgi:hypothetical protein
MPMGWETVSLNCNHQWAYCSSPRWYMSMENHGGMILTGENQITWRKTYPSVTMSTTNRTWTDPGMNLDLFNHRLVTNRLSHSTQVYIIARRCTHKYPLLKNTVKGWGGGGKDWNPSWITLCCANNILNTFRIMNPTLVLLVCDAILNYLCFWIFMLFLPSFSLDN